MIYLKDKSDDVWSTISDDFKTIMYEDGTTTPLTTSHLMVQIGKYKGMSLATVTDRGYLQWMLKSAEGNPERGDKPDVFSKYCVNLRLQQLR